MSPPAPWERFDVLGRTFTLDDPETVRTELRGVQVLLNVAGPFSRTAERLIDACIAEGVHYLDATAEFATFALAEERSEAAAAAGVMLVPGVGWDVVPSDSVAVHAAGRTPRPVGLRVALKVTGGFSRGSVASAAGIAELTGLVRAPVTSTFALSLCVMARLAFGWSCVVGGTGTKTRQPKTVQYRVSEVSS